MQKTAILVVEDDPDTQAYMRLMLERRYIVYSAASAEEAREQLREHKDRIAAILMDLSLKGSDDGFMLTGELRQDPRWENTPIIAVTAHALPEYRARALSAGCNSFLAKPFGRAELFSVLDTFLAPARSATSSAPEAGS